MSSCTDAELLDVIETVFKLENFRHGSTEDQIVDQINEFFRIDNLPYHLTKTVWEEGETEFRGTKYPSRWIRERPQIIRRDNEVIHEMAIAPTLALLRQPDLLHANEEFLLALKDYRGGDYRDCATKCGSSLESVMKVICKRKEYSYTENDTARTLLSTIISNSSLDAYWDQPIGLVATIRNRLSTSHGAGTTKKEVKEHVARYVVSSTAAAILLLHDEAY